MPQKVFRRTIILITISLYIAVSVQKDENENLKTKGVNMLTVIELPEDNLKQLDRSKRGTKKGFFRTLFSLVGEQYTDTKDTFRKVNDMINENFLPENAPVTEATTPRDLNASTTTAPYKIKRSELNKIIRRNLRGLQRLYNIELQDALKQSRITQAEYKRNVSKEVSKFL